MYSSLCIEGFRCFPRFELHGLARINLLVGANGSGKTALLEAIALLEAKGRPRAIVEAAFRRGEVVHADDGVARADIQRIFHGHAVGGEILVEIMGTTNTGTVNLALRVARRKKVTRAVTDENGKKHVVVSTQEDDESVDVPRYLMRKYEGLDEIDLSGKLTVDADGGLAWSADQAPEDARSTVLLVPASASWGDELVAMISPLLSTNREPLLLEALQIIDDQIESFRLAPSPSIRRDGSREHVRVKLRGMTSPIPIGTLGEGAWRLLSLATAMASVAGGVVLVDDIDTGLHHSVMEPMWRHLTTLATRLDVQLFASCHSRDCHEALSAVEEGRASIHHIERGRTRSV